MIAMPGEYGQVGGAAFIKVLVGKRLEANDFHGNENVRLARRIGYSDINSSSRSERSTGSEANSAK